MERQEINPKKKIMWICIGLVLLLIVFLYASTFFETKGASEPVSENGDLEKRLEEALEQMQGVGEVHVVINYAVTEEIADDTTNRSIFAQEAKPAGRSYTEMKGVLVVAEGADDIRIRTELIYAVMALLNVESDQVEILY